MKSPFIKTLVVILITTLVAPSVFLIAPQRAHAIDAEIVSCTDWTCIKTAVESTIGAIQNTITAVATPISAAANQAMWINANVLQPLAFILSGNLMKMLTAGVIGFVIGKANGTGVPQFVVDVRKSLQTVSDSQAMAYLNQLKRNSNSPFASSIYTALNTDYLQKTSLAGFWAANMCTLSRASPNVPAYLSGNWSQGGVTAWFALTTQTQNNPYLLYQASQNQLATLVGPGVGGATGARLSELSWGQGFMSWCGANSPGSLQATTDTRAGGAGTPACPPGSNYVSTDNKCEYGDGSPATPLSGDQGINPGDPCTNIDGTPGRVQTPGSTIKATLDKVLGGQQDQIVRMGNIGPQINQILGNIGTILQTVQFASQILGGPGSGGLFGVGQTSSSNATSRLAQFTPTDPTNYLGASNANVYQSAASSVVASTDPLGRILQYESAWNTIKASADAASTTVHSLATFCAAQADAVTRGTLTLPSGVSEPTFITAATEQAAAATTALTTSIAPVLARAAAVAPAVAAARALVAKVQCEANIPSGTSGSVYCDPAHPTVATNSTTNTYSTDVQLLQSMPPTASDIANAQQDIQTFNQAQANPPSSLNVSGGSLIDQLNLIATNANALKTSVCTPTAPPDGGY